MKKSSAISLTIIQFFAALLSGCSSLMTLLHEEVTKTMAGEEPFGLPCRDDNWYNCVYGRIPADCNHFSPILNPMARIVNLQELKTFLPRKGEGRIVLTGGCFDILHIGHVRFLSEARKMGDYLVVLVENDKKVKKLKGINRPVFTQKERAEMLSALSSVNLVILLPVIESDSNYLNLVMKIKPDIIAVTENDPLLEQKKAQAKRSGAELKVISSKKTLSTSKLAKILGVD
jgi:rfaE bifunctional protein nucleotidyltransferase chain/domain